MTDLTKITTPYGLLDAETRKALVSYDGEIELYDGRGWISITPGAYSYVGVYRAKRQPPKPREWWMNVYSSGGLTINETKALADDAACEGRVECVHVREVRE